ncbi:TPA: stress response translation initiation inhibitor YciH [Candidatus Woesearchaeota archaeon]|nr:stress response translation initiation inhibitor YciH [Candidatus Woesearchaeota archaeon]HIH39174.1 stress response translation initiation inhibitor YciH [Candidatus Woesearchaeota archaeon]
MSEVCQTCGLPKELCVCESIAKESQKIKVYTVEKKFGKIYTIIEGIGDKQISLKELTKKLKSKLACGGTVNNGNVELQGNHKHKVMNVLAEVGFSPETIEIR